MSIIYKFLPLARPFASPQTLDFEHHCVQSSVRCMYIRCNCNCNAATKRATRMTLWHQTRSNHLHYTSLTYLVFYVYQGDKKLTQSTQDTHIRSASIRLQCLDWLLLYIDAMAYFRVLGVGKTFEILLHRGFFLQKTFHRNIQV